jgi:ferritin-like metal-binding protein YciE
MRGLVEEATHEIGDQDSKDPILDLVMVASRQRIEHHEIAAYGTAVALARALGEKEGIDLLTLTLEKEKQTDVKLTKVTQQHIMRRYGRKRDQRPTGRKKQAAARAKAA